MENLDIGFWIQILLYAVSFGTMYGTLQTRLKYMEEKLDKHNHLVERMYAVEGRCNASEHDISDMKQDIKEIKDIISK